MRSVWFMSGAVAMVAMVAAVACQEPDPTWGDPGAIRGNALPNETLAGGAGGENIFGGAYDANAGKPAKSMLQSHQGTAGPQQANDQIDCMTCHVAGTTTGAPEFAFGGRIIANGQPSASADVLVVVGDKKVGPVKSDADGFFWSPGTALAAGGKAYVRGAGGERNMNEALAAGATGGGCDNANCHVPGKQGKVTL